MVLSHKNITSLSKIQICTVMHFSSWSQDHGYIQIKTHCTGILCSHIFFSLLSFHSIVYLFLSSSCSRILISRYWTPSPTKPPPPWPVQDADWVVSECVSVYYVYQCQQDRTRLARKERKKEEEAAAAFGCSCLGLQEGQPAKVLLLA